MNLFLTIALVQIVALVTPGPDFFFVSQLAASRSRREALAGVIGIALGVAVWAALALLGLQILLHRLAWLERGIAIAGGAYLCWMGFQMLRASWKAKADAAAPVVDVRGSSPGRALMRGLATNLANPKAAIYFASIFSAFVGDGMGAAARWGLWAMVTVETFLWFAIVAGIFALPAMRRGYVRASRWIDGGAGAIFVLFGLHLVFGRRAA
ncbi:MULTISPECIES: threonine export protein RhtC [unclassified Luteibacter]|uniref:threonine export protein RhtC n=1 Tax=unclassified Luteibacter TaxID=2620188 RepID=UPI0008CAB24C|nr:MULTISPECIES: threonine export protein RhtC [unclassified Luteibacter]MDR6938240.1 threonine efflux protein [Luteibacter sp. 3190]SEP09586.1 threonine efflux protein [Luteibacter sp. UNC138MFCol5.1]SEW06021.1 threonine efflux protein [Luteibacter sp. 329MFSha]